MTDELLKEFEPQVREWRLIPSDGGRFEVEIDGKLVFSKLAKGRHIEVDEMRRLLRQAVDAQS